MATWQVARERRVLTFADIDLVSPSFRPRRLQEVSVSPTAAPCLSDPQAQVQPYRCSVQESKFYILPVYAVCKPQGNQEGGCSERGSRAFAPPCS